MKIDIQETITNRIIASLEAGTAPWRKPWTGGGLPRNAVSGKVYSGINFFLLASLGGGQFLTYKQAQDLGGTVRKGERGCPIVFWNWVEKEANGQTKKIPFLRHFTVFSASQCDGLNLDPEGEAQPLEFSPIEKAEETIAGTGATIQHEGHRAFYRPSTDSITLPEKARFHSVGEYYSTAFHELVHWTGHESRLARKGIAEVSAFGDPVYSREELVAEMGAAFLCADHGIDSTLENSASYLRGWIDALRGDSKLVVQAAGAAWKAANLIRGTVTTEA
jgi:antirestriction protein ArdC